MLEWANSAQSRPGVYNLVMLTKGAYKEAPSKGKSVKYGLFTRQCYIIVIPDWSVKQRKVRMRLANQSSKLTLQSVQPKLRNM